MVRRGLVTVSHVGDRHGGLAADDLRQHAGVAWAEMSHDDIGQADIRRHRAKQLLERFDATRRSTDTDDGNAWTLWHGRHLHSEACGKFSGFVAGPRRLPE